MGDQFTYKFIEVVILEFYVAAQFSKGNFFLNVYMHPNMEASTVPHLFFKLSYPPHT